MKIVLFERNRLWAVPLQCAEGRVWLEVRADTPEEAIWGLREVRNGWAINPTEVQLIEEESSRKNERMSFGFALSQTRRDTARAASATTEED